LRDQTDTALRSDRLRSAHYFSPKNDLIRIVACLAQPDALSYSEVDLGRIDQHFLNARAYQEYGSWRTVHGDGVQCGSLHVNRISGLWKLSMTRIAGRPGRGGRIRAPAY
jgi:hypothetical protein